MTHELSIPAPRRHTRSYKHGLVLRHQGHLRRLASEFYRGTAFVHWTLTVELRLTGWLSSGFHEVWRCMLVHAGARYDLLCPAYVLMPDHAHLLWLGINAIGSDQAVAIEYLCRHTNLHLSPASWQQQPYDHVLRESERAHGAFQATANYIFENPVRAGLAARWQDYPYLGCCVPGYPEFDVGAGDYWERFWRCYNYLIEAVPARWRSQPPISRQPS